jgi:hypothetical protein
LEHSDIVGGTVPSNTTRLRDRSRAIEELAHLDRRAKVHFTFDTG